MFLWEAYLDKEKRITSYNFIEKFIADLNLDRSEAPKTLEIVSAFQYIISNLDKYAFAFLILHSGYIPEGYAADSSAETLYYSKMIEAVVMGLAKRIGFDKSVLPILNHPLYVVICKLV